MLTISSDELAKRLVDTGVNIDLKLTEKVEIVLEAAQPVRIVTTMLLVGEAADVLLEAFRDAKEEVS